MSAPVHVVRVVLRPGKNGGTEVGLAGKPERRLCENNEAPSSGVCMALEATARAVARWEIPADDGLVVRVEIEREGSSAEASRRVLEAASDLVSADGKFAWDGLSTGNGHRFLEAVLAWRKSQGSSGESEA